MKASAEIRCLDPQKRLHGFTEALDGCPATNKLACTPKLVLVYPDRNERIKADTSGFCCIDFSEYADLISPPLERTFAHYLGKWQSEPGKKRPCWLPADSQSQDS